MPVLTTPRSKALPKSKVKFQLQAEVLPEKQALKEPIKKTEAVTGDHGKQDYGKYDAKGNRVWCALCLDDEDADKYYCVLACGHHFHSTCFERWLVKGKNTRCPCHQMLSVKRTIRLE